MKYSYPHPLTVRLDDATYERVQKLSTLASIGDVDVVRMAVAQGLPVIEKTLGQLDTQAKEAKPPDLDPARITAILDRLEPRLRDIAERIIRQQLDEIRSKKKA
jgi:hypothetical protein